MEKEYLTSDWLDLMIDGMVCPHDAVVPRRIKHGQ